MWRRVTSRGLQVFVAGALAINGFSPLLNFAFSLSLGDTGAAVVWAMSGIRLPLALALLIGSRLMVRVVQIYLLLHAISGIVILATVADLDPRYPPVWTKTTFSIYVCEEAILLILLFWSTSKAFGNATLAPNQAMESTARSPAI